MKNLARDELLALEAEVHRYNIIRNREIQSRPGGLIEFVRYFWDVLEPNTPMVDGWPMEAICLHLEAVAYRRINRLLITVPPGFCKSLLTDVFLPAWMWCAAGLPSTRIVAFSYAASLTERDNGRFRDLMMSEKFQEMWGDKFKLIKIGEKKVTNNKTGWKLASSVGGVGTGERGNIVILDDPHSIKNVESPDVRQETVRWFREAMSNRLNDMEKDSIIVIMQRSHEEDVAGVIMENEMGYVILSIQMEFEIVETSGMENEIGWVDPREYEGELAWPDRFSAKVCQDTKVTIGPYAWAAQYQQIPSPRGGGILRREWWREWNQQEAQKYHLEWNDNGRREFPHFNLTVASLDTAYGLKQENDFCALTIWGFWQDLNKNPRVMLAYAWAKRLPLHGTSLEPYPGESPLVFKERQKQAWGLCELIADDCKRYRVQRLLIEDKNRGRDVAEELIRLYQRENWGVELINPDIDKVARAHGIVPLLADGVIWAPSPQFRWVDQVITQCAKFPRDKHDDLTDTVTQCINWARINGLLQRSDEVSAAMEEEMIYRPKPESVAQHYGV